MDGFQSKLHDTFVEDYILQLENKPLLYWTKDKNTYYTEEYITNFIKKTVFESEIIQINEMEKILNCSAVKKIILQLQTELSEWNSFTQDFIYINKFKQGIKKLIIYVIEKNEYLISLKDLKQQIISLSTKNIHKQSIQRLFEINQFDTFVA